MAEVVEERHVDSSLQFVLAEDTWRRGRRVAKVESFLKFYVDCDNAGL